MIEHRLIEKMLGIVAREGRRIRSGGTFDPVFVDTAVDFIRTYADRTHHGKEEDILFRDLAVKPLGKDDAAVMAELVDEHRLAREKVRTLVQLKERLQAGDTNALDEMLSLMEWLGDFYAGHIRKEDRVFFPRAEAYFSKEELDAMLLAFRDFDATMIHEKYEKLVKSFPPGTK
jgi:hemerythrin-like domain-containing protein